FSQKITRSLALICFLTSFITPSVMYGCRCYYDFKYAWLFACFDGACAESALTLNSILANGICLLIILVYARIFMRHRSHRIQFAESSEQESERDRRKRAKETRLMIQFGLISSVLIANQVFFWIFLKVPREGPTEIILNFLGNLNSSIS